MQQTRARVLYLFDITCLFKKYSDLLFVFFTINIKYFQRSEPHMIIDTPFAEGFHQ